MKRRERTEGSNVTQYRWDLGWNVVNEENGSGTLERTYTHSPVFPTGTILAHVDGTNPSTGDYEYYFTDHLGSTRHIFDQSKSIINSYSFKPYGELLNWSGSGAGTNHLFTGKAWDAAAAQYYFPYRQYDPRQGSIGNKTTPQDLCYTEPEYAKFCLQKFEECKQRAGDDIDLQHGCSRCLTDCCWTTYDFPDGCEENVPPPSPSPSPPGMPDDRIERWMCYIACLRGGKSHEECEKECYSIEWCRF